MVLMSLAMGGCTPSRTFVLLQPSRVTVPRTLALRHDPATATVDPKDTERFEKKLAGKLKSVGGFEMGDPAELVIEYRFVLYDTGSEAARVTSGVAGVVGSPFYGIGDGSIGVEVTYATPDGARVGHIVTDGPISGAFASSDSAMDAVATEIAKYTRKNFATAQAGTPGDAKAPSPANQTRNSE